ncbi:unnamed protein product [Kuraishia capsulata CBS 1993]|uniref:Inner centromere protein ARK-binding domain-containing protein n=1 Tax=Kuraishia capsulata CBS 1993 TaxID=1382522 RepID=W6MVW5_9ASCO|nr:uncharacterized protein KUCA_T00002578001 [Kuraishia capsulata CBS 1993]CDK26605.1 unnamed protein product [Kuraishia capsulata CBS 1993]
MESFWGAKAVPQNSTKRYLIGSSKWVACELLKTSERLEMYYSSTAELVGQELEWINDILGTDGGISEMSVKLQACVSVACDITDTANMSNTAATVASESTSRKREISLLEASPLKIEPKKSRHSMGAEMAELSKKSFPEIKVQAIETGHIEKMEVDVTNSVEQATSGVTEVISELEIDKSVLPESTEIQVSGDVKDVTSRAEQYLVHEMPQQPEPSSTVGKIEPEVVTVALPQHQDSDLPTNNAADAQKATIATDQGSPKRKTLTRKTPTAQKAAFAFATLPSRGPLTSKSAKSQDTRSEPSKVALMNKNKQGVRLLSAALNTDVKTDLKSDVKTDAKTDSKIKSSDTTKPTRDSFYTQLTVSPTPKPLAQHSVRDADWLAKNMMMKKNPQEDSPFIETKAVIPPLKTGWLTVPPLGQPSLSSPINNGGSPIKQPSTKSFTKTSKIERTSLLGSFARRVMSPIKTALSPKQSKVTAEVVQKPILQPSNSQRKSPARPDVSHFMQPTQASVARMTAEQRIKVSRESPTRFERNAIDRSKDTTETDLISSKRSVLSPVSRIEFRGTFAKSEAKSRIHKPEFSLLKHPLGIRREADARLEASKSRGTLNIAQPAPSVIARKAASNEKTKPLHRVVSTNEKTKPFEKAVPNEKNTIDRTALTKPVPLTTLSLSTHPSKVLPVKAMMKPDSDLAKQRQSASREGLNRTSRSYARTTMRTSQSSRNAVTGKKLSVGLNLVNSEEHDLVVPKETRQEFIQRLSSNLKSSASSKVLKEKHLNEKKSFGTKNSRVLQTTRDTIRDVSAKKHPIKSLSKEPVPFNETLPEIFSDDDQDSAPFKDWAKSPNLAGILLSQQRIDPSTIFGQIPKVTDDVFKTYDKRRPRTSSAQWNPNDMVTEEEKENYKLKMGFQSSRIV